MAVGKEVGLMIGAAVAGFNEGLEVGATVNDDVGLFVGETEGGCVAG